MERSFRNRLSQPAHSIPRRIRIGISVCLIGLFLTITSLLIISLTSFDLPILFPVLALSFGLFTTGAILLRINPVVTIMLAGLGLAFLSFTYQSLGPEQRMIGTECRPIQDCLRPVLGGGFPVQFAIDIPGITYWNALGFEDDFRLWPFIADTCFYICLASLTYLIIKRLKLRRLKPMAEAA